MSYSRTQRISALLALSLGVSAATSAQAVGTRHFLLDKGSDFKGGDLKGVAVDSTGAVRAGLSLTATPLALAGAVWSVLPQRDGSFLVGTGNEGKLLRVTTGTATVVGETKALAVTSLVEAWAGSVVVGTLPDGRVMKFERDKLVDFAQLKGAEHVFQIAYDAKAQVAYAATGPEGKLFRSTQN